jgi:hypothetical protein
MKYLPLLNLNWILNAITNATLLFNKYLLVYEILIFLYVDFMCGNIAKLIH